MKVRFIPLNIEVDASPEKSLLQIATENKIEIRSLCKGVPSCAECRVKITKGEDSIPVPTKAELNLIGTTYSLDGRRLACQVHCFGDIEVDLTEQLDRQENQKRKIRGYKTDQQTESKAVLDTLILSETKEDLGAPSAKKK